MEEPTKEIKKKWKTFWTIVGIVLFVSYFTLLVVLMYLKWGQAERWYMDGFNGTFEGYARTIYSFIVWLGTLPTFTLMLIYACFLKSMFRTYSRIRRLKIVFLVSLILLNPISMLYVLGASHQYKEFTEGYRDWAKSVLDFDEIRDWMFEYDERNTGIGTEDFQGPKCFAENHLRMSAGWVRENEKGERILSIMSGGGLQDWGIVIGPAEMEVPSSETVMYDKYQGEYRLKLVDGAYVYYELQ